MSERLPPEPIIPAELQEVWNLHENAQIAHGRLASQTLSEIMADMPTVSYPYQLNRKEPNAGYAEFTPQGVDYDRTRGVVIGAPFGNDFNEFMGIRFKLLAESLPEPLRVIIFPNPTVDESAFNLNPVELETVTSGHFRPIIERRFRTLATLGIEKPHFLGYSQDAALGATAIRLAVLGGHFEVGASGLFEWPNGVARTAKELKKAFIKTGLGNLNRAINESAIPALSEAQLSRGGFDTPRQLLRFAQGNKNAKLPVNKALHQGMATNFFSDELSIALRHDSQIPLLLGSGALSKITTLEARNYIKTDPVLSEQADEIVVSGYGHELGDNVVAHTLLGLLALYYTEDTDDADEFELPEDLAA